MTDIVQRLRLQAEGELLTDVQDFHAAADEIERLQRFVKAVTEPDCGSVHCVPCGAR